MLELLPFSTVGAPLQRLRVKRNAELTPRSETPDKKARLFILFLSPARRMKKAVIRMISSGPIADHFISSKLITISISLIEGSGRSF